MGDLELVPDSERLQTKELLRRQRKLAYEAAKSQRKQEKRAQKKEDEAQRLAARTQRDQELWQALRPAKTLADGQE